MSDVQTTAFPPTAIAEILFRCQSEFQEVLLTREEDGILQLTLDGFWQFHSDDEHIYHEVLVDTAMVLAERLDKVAILGGGDGLALRNVLRYPVDRAVLCELDPQMIHMTRTIPEMIELSKNSLSDPRAEVIVKDALRWIVETPERFDVVISDFPASTRAEIDVLFSFEFFWNASKILKEDGILAVQVSQRPERYWEIYGRIAQIFDWAVPLLVKMGLGADGEEYWANFIVARRTAPEGTVRDVAPGTRFLTLEKIPRLVIQKFDMRGFATLDAPLGITRIEHADEGTSGPRLGV